MKVLLTTYLMLFASLIFAESVMSEEQMMKQAEAVEECFSKIDPSTFERFAARGREMEKELEALCAAGKRDEAMSAAMKYGKEFSASQDLQEMRKCSELIQGMMANMPKTYMPPEIDEDGSNSHICDDM